MSAVSAAERLLRGGAEAPVPVASCVLLASAGAAAIGLALGASSGDPRLALYAAAKVPLLVVTRGDQGAVAVRGGEQASIPAEPIERLVDTTGAGDLFAAGFLAGQARGLGLEASLRLGAIAAAEVIQHYGARPEADLKALAGDIL